MKTAYCSECGKTVVLTADEQCPSGHPRPCLRGLRDVEVQAANAQPIPDRAKRQSTRSPLVKVVWIVVAFVAILPVVYVIRGNWLVAGPPRPDAAIEASNVAVMAALERQLGSEYALRPTTTTPRFSKGHWSWSTDAGLMDLPRFPPEPVPGKWQWQTNVTATDKDNSGFARTITISFTTKWSTDIEKEVADGTLWAPGIAALPPDKRRAFAEWFDGSFAQANHSPGQLQDFRRASAPVGILLPAGADQDWVIKFGTGHGRATRTNFAAVWIPEKRTWEQIPYRR